MKINRKKIIVTFVVLLIAITIWFFGFLNKTEQGEILDETKNLFPFGIIETGTPAGNNQNQETFGGEFENQETNEPFEEENLVAGPRLRRISDFPTGGFAPIIRTEDKEITDISIDSEGNSSQTVQTIQVENTYVRYSTINDATIYETKLTPAITEQEILAENFIPNAEQVFFSKNGDNALFQYWNRDSRTIETYLGKIKKLEMNIEECPYDFSRKLKLGDEGNYVLEIHEFLNKTPQTRIAISGMNSPGNEGALVVESTITAIKNFQSLHGLDIDGKIGTATRTKMNEICDLEQKQIAEETFNNLENKYEISGFFLPQGITTLSIRPDGKEFFYMQENSLGIVGIIRNFIDNKKRTIFESPYSEWISNWNNIDSIEITTKASYQSDGYIYKIDPIDGEYHKSFKQRKGLTTLASPDNTKIFVQESLKDSIRSSIYNMDINRMRPLIIQTFPEKCTWSSDSLILYCAVPNSLAYGGEYPDVWYQGLETYNDSLWRIDAKTNKVDVLSDLPTEFGQNIDVVEIGIDENSEYLYFIDKNTEFLWSYRLQDL